jgi:hypothetical protein
MARYYNAKVKLRRFEVGDWVLRKVTQATKDPSQGKLGLIGKVPTRSSNITERAHIIWKTVTEKSCLTHGTLSTSRNTTCEVRISVIFYDKEVCIPKQCLLSMNRRPSSLK